MSEPFDCSPGWEERYGGSAYARGVCLSVEQGLGTAESIMFNVEQGAAAGAPDTKTFLEGVSSVTGRSVADLWRDPTGATVAAKLGLPIEVAGLPTTWVLGGGAALAALGLWRWKGRKKR